MVLFNDIILIRPGGGTGNPLHYSCLKKILWTEEIGGATVHGIAKSGHDYATEHSQNSY